MIVERSENIARGRFHFLVVANANGDFEIPVVTQNKQNKVKQLALSKFLHTCLSQSRNIDQPTAILTRIYVENISLLVQCWNIVLKFCSIFIKDP